MTRVPPGWKHGTLRDVCGIVSGGTPKTGVADFWGGHIAWLTPNDLSKDRSQTVARGERQLTNAGYKSCSAKTFPAGSVIVSSRAPIGYVAIAGQEMCTNQGCKTAIPPDFIDPKYLYWYMLNSKADLESRASGTTFKEISGKGFGETELVWPDLREQRGIVDILEDHLSRLDAGDRSLTLALQRASTLRASVIDRAAQGSLDGGQAGQDGLCQGWAWVPPAEVSDERKGIVIGPFGSNLKTSDYRDEGVPLVFVRNVRRGYFGPIGQRYVSVAKAAELSPHEVLHGDVVITKMGDPPGEAAVYDATEPGVITADVIRLRPRPDQSSDYLALAINSSMVARQIQQITRGVAQKKVSLARFRSEVRIPVPDLETQIRVARQVADLTEGVARIVRQSEAAKTHALSLRRSLLTAAFSGRLTGRTSDMEMVGEMAGV
jgi:type I restriction enzyme S subunit